MAKTEVVSGGGVGDKLETLIERKVIAEKNADLARRIDQIGAELKDLSHEHLIYVRFVNEESGSVSEFVSMSSADAGDTLMRMIVCMAEAGKSGMKLAYQLTAGMIRLVHESSKQAAEILKEMRNATAKDGLN